MDEINSEEKAYWLGFFYADAYNNEKRGRVVVELQERDKEHLFKCAKFFGQPREPFKQLKNKGKYIAYRLELNSKHLSNTLREKGCHGNKSFNIIFPGWLEKNLVRHFIRGYFDGDGCIHLNSKNQLNIQIVSTKEMINHIHEIIKNFNINSYISKPKRYKDNTWRMDFGGNLQVLKFCEWIYTDAAVFLERKHKVYSDFNNNYQQLVDARSKTKYKRWWAKSQKSLQII